MLAYYEGSGEWKAKILAADKGDVLADGDSEAADKRVFFGAQYFANLNNAGKTLFNQALEWAAWDVVYTSIVTDIEPPVITLLGDNPQIIQKGSTYSELGATAVDNVDTNVSVVIDSSAVNTNIVGSYYVHYAAYDTLGNESNEERYVIVVESSSIGVLNIALVCKKSSCNDDEEDIPLKNHLESLEHTVETFKDDDKSWTPENYDVIVISASAELEETAWLKDALAPILTIQGEDSDELAMGDGGSSKGGKSKYIIIDNPSAHYITQGFAAGVPIQVSTSVDNLGHMTGYDGYGIQELAHYDTNGAVKAKILVADSGALLVDGSSAADKRVFFGAQHFDNLNANGITLFDRALEWAVIP